MKRLILLMFILMAGMVSAEQWPDFNIAVDDKAPVTDVLLSTQIIQDIANSGYGPAPQGIAKLFSEVDDLEDKIVLALKNNEAVIILGYGDDEFVDVLHDILNDRDIGYDTVLSQDVDSISGLFEEEPEDIELICYDSDDDKDYFTLGMVDYDKEYFDECNGSELIEYYCDGVVKNEVYSCPNGCANGACIVFSGDVEDDQLNSSDECPSKSCFIKTEQCYGTDKLVLKECMVYIKSEGECEEIITTESDVVEGVCDVKNERCNNGCLLDENKCLPFGIRFDKEDLGYYCDIDGSMIEQKVNGEMCQNSHECVSNNCKDGFCKRVCEGCLTDNVCLPIGTRDDLNYCGSGYEMQDQVPENSNCNNDYECESNLCIERSCVELNIIQKIVDWFKSVFSNFPLE